MVDYSKWDKFDELVSSDEEEQDVSPYVDKKSFMKWKKEASTQKKIQEAKERGLIPQNATSLPKVEELTREVKSVTRVGTATAVESTAPGQSNKDILDRIVNSTMGPNLGFEKIFATFSDHPGLVSAESMDHCFLQAFDSLYPKDGSAGIDKAPTLAVNKMTRYIRLALTLKYSVNVGRDGFGMFFRRMQTSEEARQSFEQDVQENVERVKDRGKAIQESASKRQTAFEAQQRVMNSMPPNLKAALDNEDLGAFKEGLDALDKDVADKIFQDCIDVGLLGPPDEDPVDVAVRSEEAKKAAAASTTDIDAQD